MVLKCQSEHVEDGFEKVQQLRQACLPAGRLNLTILF
jgi:hypothetical protein